MATSTTARVDPHVAARPRRPMLVLAAVAVTVAAWASAFIVIRGVRDTFDPGALALGRLAVGTAVLGLFVIGRRSWVRPSLREWTLMAGCGIAWFALYNVALNAAEQRVDAGTAAMLVNVGPLLIAVLAAVLLGEGFPRWLGIGGAVAFSGTLVTGAAVADDASTDAGGVVLCLLAALAWAVGVTAQKPVLRRLPALQVTLVACAVGALACVPFSGGLVTDLGNASAGSIAALAYLGVVPTALAFFTWAYALSRMPAGRLGVTTYLVPPLTVLVAWAALGETPPALALVGGAVALVGIALARRA